VSVAKCYALQSWCQENKVECKFRVFEKQGHLFEDDLKRYGVATPLLSKDMQEAHREVFAFLARHLRAEESVGAAK
jgi:hypothetical protein